MMLFAVDAAVMMHNVSVCCGDRKFWMREAWLKVEQGANNRSSCVTIAILAVDQQKRPSKFELYIG